MFYNLLPFNLAKVPIKTMPTGLFLNCETFNAKYKLAILTTFLKKSK